jgi:hypothetical protein
LVTDRMTGDFSLSVLHMNISTLGVQSKINFVSKEESMRSLVLRSPWARLPVVLVICLGHLGFCGTVFPRRLWLFPECTQLRSSMKEEIARAGPRG